jgi:hypothetical protein
MAKAINKYVYIFAQVYNRMIIFNNHNVSYNFKHSHLDLNGKHPVGSYAIKGYEKRFPLPFYIELLFF